MRATGWSPSQTQMQILKGLYPQAGTVRPKWAQLAYDRKWITLAAFLKVPAERGRGPLDLLYEDSPFFKLLKGRA